MRSSGDRFLHSLERWKRDTSHVLVKFFSRCRDLDFEGVVTKIARGDSVSFRDLETGEEYKIVLRGAEARVGLLPSPVDKCDTFEEMEYGICFNILWEADSDTRCTMTERRDFGETV
jgi:hypothetical protein